MCHSNVKENHLAERQVHVLNQWTDKHFQVIQFEADYKLLLGFYNLQYALILVILGMSKMGLSDILIIWIIIIKFHHGLYCLNLIFKILPSDIITKKTPFTEVSTMYLGYFLIICTDCICNYKASWFHCNYCFSQRNSSSAWYTRTTSTAQFMTIKNATQRMIYSLNTMPYIPVVKWKEKGIHLCLKRNRNHLM